MSKADKDGWIRHRGGKAPVSDDVFIDVRYRDGEILKLQKFKKSEAFLWAHHNGCSDIMAYKLHKPAEQPSPVSEEAIQVGIDAADAGKLTPLAEVKARVPSLKTERALKDAREGNTAKFSSIDELMQDLGEPVISFEEIKEGMTVRFSRFTNTDHRHWKFTPGKEYRVCRIGGDVGPVADSGHIPSANWGFEFTLVDGLASDIRSAAEPPQDTILLIRDRITEIDATTQALTAERAELVQKLASEGFALIGRINELLTDSAQKHEDMSDWRNWKVGDLVEMVKAGEWEKMTNGKLYKFAVPKNRDNFAVIDDDGELRSFSIGLNNSVSCDFKWHSRPSA